MALLVASRLHEPNGLVADEGGVINTNGPGGDHLGKPVTASAKGDFLDRAEPPGPSGMASAWPVASRLAASTCVPPGPAISRKTRWQSWSTRQAGRGLGLTISSRGSGSNPA